MRRLPALHVKGEPAVLPDRAIRRQSHYFIYRPRIWICHGKHKVASSRTVLSDHVKPVLCSRMVSLFLHTSPWTHRCLQSSPSAHRNGRVFRRSVQTARCYWILNRVKSSSIWNSQTNASRLWWSVCWCEYSETLGKEVQRWRTGGKQIWVTKHEVECLWLQGISFIKIALKNGSAEK